MEKSKKVEQKEHNALPFLGYSWPRFTRGNGIEKAWHKWEDEGELRADATDDAVLELKDRGNNGELSIAGHQEEVYIGRSRVF